MWPDWASLVLATFAEPKVARLPGRNPAPSKCQGQPPTHGGEEKCQADEELNNRFDRY
jgi:hypothetical protein